MPRKVRPYSVYRNLHIRDRVGYSVRNGSRVERHTDELTLFDCVMKHPTPKQREVVRTGDRSVVCWIRGSEILAMAVPDTSLRRLACDPRKVDWFCDFETGDRVDRADLVTFRSDGVWYL